MKVIYLFFSFLFFAIIIAGCSGEGGDGKKLPMELVINGTYSGVEAKKELILNNNDEYQKLMSEVYNNLDQMPRIPVVDFTKYTLIAVFIGPRNTGGYMVNIDSINDGNKSVSVSVVEETPGKNCNTMQIVTRPYTIVKIPKTDKKAVFTYKQIVKDCQ